MFSRVILLAAAAISVAFALNPGSLGADYPTNTAEAFFTSHGLGGSILFFQVSSGTATTIKVDLTGLNNQVTKWEIHEFPMSAPVYGSRACTLAEVDGVWDNVPKPIIETPGDQNTIENPISTGPETPNPDRKASGDLSGKFGLLNVLKDTAKPVDNRVIQDIDPIVATSGEYSVVGRSLVLTLTTGELVCSNINYLENTVTLFANFENGPLDGSVVRLTQILNRPDASVQVFADLRYADGENMGVDYTTGHTWHIHRDAVLLNDNIDSKPQNPKGQDPPDTITPQRCASAGGLFPQNADNNQTPKRSGDLSFYTGLIKIAATGAKSKFLFNIENLPLQPTLNDDGQIVQNTVAKTAVAKSIVIHGDVSVGQDGRLDCVNIATDFQLNYATLSSLTADTAKAEGTGVHSLVAGIMIPVSLLIMIVLGYLYKRAILSRADRLFGGVPMLKLRVVNVLIAFTGFVILTVAVSNANWSVFGMGHMGAFDFCSEVAPCENTLSSDDVPGKSTLLAVRWTSILSVILAVMTFAMPIGVHFGGIPERFEWTTCLFALMSAAFSFSAMAAWGAYHNDTLLLVQLAIKDGIELSVGPGFFINIVGCIFMVLAGAASYILVVKSRGRTDKELKLAGNKTDDSAAFRNVDHSSVGGDSNQPAAPGWGPPAPGWGDRPSADDNSLRQSQR